MIDSLGTKSAHFAIFVGEQTGRGSCVKAGTLSNGLASLKAFMVGRRCELQAGFGVQRLMQEARKFFCCHLSRTKHGEFRQMNRECHASPPHVESETFLLCGFAYSRFSLLKVVCDGCSDSRIYCTVVSCNQ